MLELMGLGFLFFSVPFLSSPWDSCYEWSCALWYQYGTVQSACDIVVVKFGKGKEGEISHATSEQGRLDILESAVKRWVD
ncbi:hypothetical protein HOY82DRAFT_371994 [Tuber indicum]|nr:hypothetical protein HOY82DRAFT_371994 [Tuber indicum]